MKLFKLVAIATAIFGASLGIAPPAGAAEGAIQISGIGQPDFDSICDSAADGVVGTPDSALVMTGDLEGCWYQFWGPSSWNPNGNYAESGREVFVGTFQGQAATVETTYFFRGTFATPQDFSEEIRGFCQHFITAGTGTGALQGADGRVKFTDDVVNFNFPYKGHLKLS